MYKPQVEETMRTTIILIVFFAFMPNYATSQNWIPMPNSVYFGTRCDDMSFIDSYGWAVNSHRDSVYKTSDYGESWESVGILSGYLRSIEFLNKDIGIAGAFRNGIYRTSDGGITWDTIPILDTNFYGVCGIHINEDSTIFAVGTYFRAALIMRSKDLGLTWEVTNLNDKIEGLVDVKFYDNQVGLITGTGKNGGVVYRTTDGGDTWNLVYDTGVPDELGWKIDFTTDEKFTFISVQNLTADSTSILKSSDRGLTWTEIRHPYTQIQGICFWDEMNGAIGGWGLPIYETTDGGKSWEEEIYTGTANVNRFLKFENYSLAAGNLIFKKANNPTSVKNNIPVRPRNLEISISSDIGEVDVNINADFPDQIIYSVYDVSGKVLISKQLEYLSKGFNSFKLSSKFKSGVYFISMLNVEGIYKEKFLVE